MRHLSKEQQEQQREQSRQALEEHKEREQRFSENATQKAKKKKIIMAVVGVVLIAAIAIGAYAVLSPGQWDEFAQCLTEKGVVMQGENWCPYTRAQKGMFGKSFKHINYEVNEGLAIRPTWIIDGKTYEKVQSFERLAALTGCELNGGEQ